MKTFPTLLTLMIASFALLTAQAQGSSPGLGGATAKLFGEHQKFTAAMEYEITLPNSKDPMVMPGKMSFDAGKSRFEMNLGDIKGSAMPPEAFGQLKAMGMDATVSISRPDKKVSYVIYPRTQSYIETPLLDQSTAESIADFKTETTELGSESLDGHDCMKNKVVQTGKDKIAHVSIVWNARDLNNFPVKIESSENGSKTVMHFKKVTFEKPAGSLFEVPTGLTKYTSAPEMMKAVMMKRMGGTTGN